MSEAKTKAEAAFSDDHLSDAEKRQLVEQHEAQADLRPSVKRGEEAKTGPLVEDDLLARCRMPEKCPRKAFSSHVVLGEGHVQARATCARCGDSLTVDFDRI